MKGPFLKNKAAQRGVAQFAIVVVLLLGLGMAVWFGAAIAQEDTFKLALMGGGLLGLSVLLIMGKKYWYLLAFAYAFGYTPIPVGGREILLQELVTPMVFVWFLFNIALKRQKFVFSRMESIFIFLYCGWAAMVMYLNPVGLSMFGASEGGFRFYADIGMALCAYLVISNQKITNKDCQWIIAFLIIVPFLALMYQIYFYMRYGASMDMVGESYSWHQSLGGPAKAILLYIVAKYRWPQIFQISKLHLPVILLLCVAVTFLSGKRAGVATILIIVIVSAFLRKEFLYAFAAIAFTAIVVTTLVAGHGNLFNLPVQVQRSLANLPGDWDYDVRSLTAQGSDTFRTRLWDIAKDKIRKNPIIGNGFQVSNYDFSVLASGGVDTIQIELLAMGSSWHNLWLGISADFGIPAAIIFGLFMIQSTIAAWRLQQNPLLEKSQRILVFMILLMFLMNVITSYSGGHSAHSPMGAWWMYGILIGLKYSLQEKRHKPNASDANASQSPAALKI